MDFAPLQRQPHALAAAIAADVAERHAENIEHKADCEIAAGGRRDATGDEALRLEEVGRLLDARRHICAHVVDHGAALETDELIVAEISTEEIRLAREVPGAAGEIAERGAILRGHLAEILRAVVAARTRDVLHDHLRLPVEVLGEMPREHAALDVGRRPGVEVDEHGEALAFVERLLRHGGATHGAEAEAHQYG